MADTVGEATFLVKIRDMVTGPMKGIAASISTTLRDISKIAAGNLLSTGIMKAVDGMKDLIAGGIAMNVTMDNLNVTFTTMLGSQRKATALMGDLTKFAAETPFELKDLAAAASSMLAVGKAGSEIIPMLKKLGDAAAGSTDGFAALPRIVRAVSQAIGKGKLQTEEMNQLAEAGIPAWGALAKEMKMSQSAVMALAAKGKLGMKEIGMLVDGLGNKYAGLAEKQSKSFSGMMSTLKDNVALAMAKITRPIYDKMTAVMAQIAKFMASGAFTKGLDRITAIVSHIMELLFKAFDSPLVKAVVKIAAIAAAIIAVGAALSWVPALYGLAAALAPTVAVVVAIGAAAAALGVLINNALNSEDAKQFKQQLADIWEMIKDIGLNLRDNLMPILGRIGDAIAGAFGATGSLQSGFNEFVGTALGGLSSILDFLTILTADFGKTWEFLTASATVAVLDIADRFGYLFGTQVPHWIAAITDGFIAGGAEIVNQWKTMFDALFKFLTSGFTIWFNLQSKQIQALAQSAALVAQGRPGDAANALLSSTTANNAAAAGQTVAAGIEFKNAMAPAVSSIMAKVQEAMSGVMNVMPGFKNSDAHQDGVQLVAKLWEQMTAVRDDKSGARDRADAFNKGMEDLGLNKLIGEIGKAAEWIKGGKAPGDIGDFLGEGVADLAKGVFGAIDQGIAIFHKEDKKKKKKVEFVGFSEMNKHIQAQLGKEDKDKKAQLAAAKKGAAAAEKGAAAGAAVVKGVDAVKKAVVGLAAGFGFGK